jgi:hypothetical protein
VLPGRTVDARTFLRQLDRQRRDDYDRSEQRLAITKEVWFMASVAGHDLLIAYIEAADFQRATETFSASRNPFDLWFKDQLAQVTGLDLNGPPELDLPELPSAYDSRAAVPTPA